MQTSMVIEGLLGHIKDTTLGDFNILETFVFDDSLDFRARAIQYLTREGIFQTLESETPDEWSLFIWTRSPLTNPQQVIRSNKITYSDNKDKMSDGTFDHRLAQIDISCKLVSNSIELSETIEEYLFVYGGEHIKFSVDYGGVIGIVECSAEAQASTNFETEDLDGNGTVVAVSLDMSITYPVLIHKKSGSNIEKITSDVYANNEIDVNNPVPSDEMVVE